MLLQRSLFDVLAYSASFITLTSALPAEHVRYSPARRSETNSNIYYGVSYAEHDERSKALQADGYRVVSLSVYGTPPDAQYAAVWAQAEGASFETISGADKKTYDAWLDSWKAQGYISTHIAATGPAETAVYAGAVELANGTTWFQTCELENPWLFSNVTGNVPYIMKGFSMFGTATNRRYCMLAHENVGNQQQTQFYQHDSSSGDFQTTYDAETKKRFWRPVHLDISDDHLISSLYEDSSVGKWASQASLTESQLADEIEKQSANGLTPVSIQGSGSGDDARYTVILAEQTTPLPRKWSATGDFTGFKSNENATTAVDAALQRWMERNGVRQAQVAVALKGALIGERSFTLAESDRAMVKPDDQFLLASVSKMFTHAAVQRLVDDGLVQYNTTVYPFLGFKPADERANAITIQHLVDHTAGYDRTISSDPGFMFRFVARLKNSSEPATLLDMIEYVVEQPLDFAPGDSYAYSNYGTMLLSYLITNTTGTAYHDFLEERVLEGLKADVYETAAEKHINDPISQESRFTGMSPFFPQEDLLVPSVHGGDGAIKEEVAGSFALKASATTVAKFIGNNAVWGIGGHQPYSARDGSTNGARAFAQSAWNCDWAVVLNTRESINGEEWNNLIFNIIPDVWGRNEFKDEFMSG